MGLGNGVAAPNVLDVGNVDSHFAINVIERAPIESESPRGVEYLFGTHGAVCNAYQQTDRSLHRDGVVDLLAYRSQGRFILGKYDRIEKLGPVAGFQFVGKSSWSSRVFEDNGWEVDPYLKVNIKGRALPQVAGFDSRENDGERAIVRMDRDLWCFNGDPWSLVGEKDGIRLGGFFSGSGRSSIGTDGEKESSKQQRRADPNKPSLQQGIGGHSLRGLVHRIRGFVHTALGREVVYLPLVGLLFAALAGIGGGLILDNFNPDRTKRIGGAILLCAGLPLWFVLILLGLP